MATVFWPFALAAVVLGPALFGRGYVLSYDLVWVPDLALRADFLGTGSGLPRAVPSDAVVSVVDELVPGMLLQKVVLYAALVAAALGCRRLVGPSRTAQWVAMTVAIWNPFVAERLVIGHWPVLVGYAALPWLALEAGRARRTGRLPAALPLVMVLGSLSASAGLVSALVVLVFGVRRGAGRPNLLLVGTVVAANLPWLVAGLTHASTAVADAAGARLFATQPEGSLPAPLAALGLGGIWNAEVVPGSRTTLLAWASLMVLVALAVLGRRAFLAVTPDARRWLLVGAVGWLVAVVSWASPAALGWLGSRCPASACCATAPGCSDCSCPSRPRSSLRGRPASSAALATPSGSSPRRWSSCRSSSCPTWRGGPPARSARRRTPGSTPRRARLWPRQPRAAPTATSSCCPSRPTGRRSGTTATASSTRWAGT